MLRKLFIGGNWKCNNTLQTSRDLVTNVINKLVIDATKCEVKSLMNAGIHLSAQNISRTGTGAYTGEIAASQLADFGINWTLTGHSERRTYYGETSEIVAEKTQIALDNNVNVVLCIGEQKSDRESGNTNNIITEQMAPVWERVGDRWDHVVIAYEPVWAIGTGLVATPEQAQDTHKFIRGLVQEKAGETVAKSIRIIYGGSVKGSNCEGLITHPDIDGFLVGGASLNEDFISIVHNSQATV